MSRGGSRTAAAKGVPFSASPVLAVQFPAWRSRLVLFVLFAAFCALIARALWLQGISTEFLQKQGESRYARTLELPATRGKITDRNGQVLASSMPVKAIWAIPDDVLQAPKVEGRFQRRRRVSEQVKYDVALRTIIEHPYATTNDEVLFAGHVKGKPKARREVYAAIFVQPFFDACASLHDTIL